MAELDYKNIRPGDCLIAPPNIPDSRFSKAVILIFDHDKDGTLGLIINRVTPHTIEELTDTDDYPRVGHRTVNWGGPVHPSVVNVLHTSDWKTAKTLKITSDIFITSDSRMYDYIEHSAEPDKWKSFFGFASWSPNQLEGEIAGSYPWKKDQSWLILKNPAVEFIFDCDEEAMWDEALAMCSKQAVESWI
jgi:putative transcriptional regulator